ncbi:MAG: M20/M25/M40 family metallo-hydrolase [Acidimicrobiia bacterium]|nr:M20/M25/M40 family metallo-hydrolase [Acidimicrobiia bacterium]
MTRQTNSRRWIGAVLVVVSLTAAWFFDQPSRPMPATGVASEFSAGRALEVLADIGEDPTPIGSAENTQVRGLLVDRLETMGLEVTVEAGVGTWKSGSAVEVGQVNNVVARLRGTDSTGPVILVAHYDTVPHSPGISDDKASVAAILETVRALTESPPLRNDVVILLTDGEEPGLLGADLFAREMDPDGVILNWEGYGNRGSSVMFQTSENAQDLIGAWATSAPNPVGSSAFTELFLLGTNHTDFTRFKDAGFAGLDFTPVDGIVHYHSATDNIENLDTAAIQHHGDTMLAMTRELGERDLSVLDDGGELTYFSAFGQVFSYPVWLNWPVAVAALVALAAITFIARRRGVVTFPRVLAAFGALLIVLVVVPAAAYGLWALLMAVRPEYSAFQMGDVGDVYHPGWYRLALLALSTSIIAASYLLLRRRLGAMALSIAALTLVALLGISTAGAMPGLSYIGGLSALLAAGGILVHFTVGASHPGWSVTAITVGMLPGVILTGLTASMTLSALGIAGGLGAAAIFVFTGFLGVAAVGAVGTNTDEARSRWRGAIWVPRAALLVAVLATTVGLMTDTTGTEDPVPSHLAYLVDADQGTAVWASEDSQPSTWASQYVDPSSDPKSWPISYRDETRWFGKAETADFPPPEVSVQAVDGNPSDLRLEIRSAREADVVMVRMDRPVEEAAIETADDTIAIAPPRSSEEWPFILRFHNPPSEGFVLTLRLSEDGDPTVAVSDISYGLSGIPDFTGRPHGEITSPRRNRLPSDAVVIGKVLTP